MTVYKKSIKTRLVLFLVSFVVVSALFAISFLTLNASKSNAAGDFINGYRFGISFSVLAGLIYYIIYYYLILQSEEKLRKSYIDETDERKIMIAQKAGSNGMGLVVLGLAIASVISSFFDDKVSITLIITCLVTVLIHSGLKLYYKNKF